MSRSKKSRKPSAFDINPIREERKTVVAEPRKAKKKKGKKAGNRQQEAFQSGDNKGQGNGGKKDPRIGSKKAIVLTSGDTAHAQNKQANTPNATPKKTDSPIAKIRTVNTDDSLREELYAIEDDAQLQAIIAKQEAEETLTEAEVNYFNIKMERHQELSSILGLDDEDDTADDPSEGVADDEDALWNKLDSSDLSKFE